MPLSEESRRHILDEYFELYSALQGLDHDQGASPEFTGQEEMDSKQDRLSELWRVYEAGLPHVPLSRCPFTGEVLAMPFDSSGLDGLWWNYDAPIRGNPPRLSTYMALSGAVHLRLPVEFTPFLVAPGPGLPFVYPRLLMEGSIKAVVTSLPVGKHVAFPVVYFAPARPRGMEMPNLWGANSYQYLGPEGEDGWYQSFDTPQDWDFHLRKWIESGRLLWIAPGDSSMTLQSAVADCPYLGLPGERQEQRIYAGKVEVGLPETGQETRG
jgi:hypothetical protein